jgi:hypothetical protein
MPRVTIVLIQTALALLVCAGSDLGYADAVVKDSGVTASEYGEIYWIGKNELLFQETTNETRTRAIDGFRYRVKRVTSWNLQTGEIKRFQALDAQFCFHDGDVSSTEVDYLTKDYKTKKYWVTHGKLGNAVREEVDEAELSKYVCRKRDDLLLPDWTKGKFVWRLRPEDGFLVLGDEKGDRNTPVTYHPKGLLDGVTMPFKRREFYFPEIKFFSFKGAYFIVGDYFVPVPNHPDGGYNKSPWPSRISRPVWWLYPDGRVEEMKVPSVIRATSASFIFPAKTGIYIISPDYPYRDGLYAVTGDRVKWVLKGFIENYAVSPNGCEIAVSHNPNFTGTPERGTLKVVEVCSERN